jgi:signal recognition particle subunit SRP54
MKDLPIDDDALKPIEAIIRSMTPYERQNPDKINGSRRKRIASGSGTEVRDVNDLLKQFEQMRKMMKSMSNMGKMNRLMQGMKGINPGIRR